MIAGSVSPSGVPVVELAIENRLWNAVIDTGFNGDLELPRSLRGSLNAVYVGRVKSRLAANQFVEEDVYLLDFEFDGDMYQVEATFSDDDELLIGTRLLQFHRLQIDFVAGTVRIERV